MEKLPIYSAIMIAIISGGVPAGSPTCRGLYEVSP